MKTRSLKILTLLALSAILSISVFETGCKSTPQTQAFKTISAIETGATASMSTYFRLVIAGTVSTNGVPAVTSAFNHLQVDVGQAVIEASGNTNAAAPVALVAESVAFGATVATASTLKK